MFFPRTPGDNSASCPRDVNCIDDASGRIHYEGQWSISNYDGAFNKTISKSTVDGDTAEVIFEGTPTELHSHSVIPYASIILQVSQS